MSDGKIPFNKSVTSKDVAKRAGVSQSTVSRVFNTSAGYTVKDSLKEKVLLAAKEIGYTPNLVARGMISGKTNMIALVVGDSLGPFYNQIMNEFVEKIQQIGKQCLVFKVPRSNELDGIVSRVLQFQVEAVVITASAMTKNMTEVILNNDIPVVLFNRFLPGAKVSTVYVDPVEGAQKVAKYLCEKGHTNIGYIQFIKDSVEEREKKIGFYSELRRHQIYTMQEESSEYDYHEGYKAGMRLLSGEDRPTAIFCTSDLIAMGVVDAAKYGMGLKVPEDVAVVGYDDIAMAQWVAYNLTTVHQPLETMIDETIAIIEQLLEHDDNEEAIVKMLRPELIIRKTT